MKTAQLPPLLIFCICLIWSQPGIHSSGQQHGHKNNSFNYCAERKICGDNGYCRQKPGGFSCICLEENKEFKNPKPCIEVNCPSKQKNMNSAKCSQTQVMDQEPSAERDNNTFYCSIFDWVAGINYNCHNYKDNNSVSEPSLMKVSHKFNLMIQDISEWETMEKDERQKAAILLLDCMESSAEMVAASMNNHKCNLTTTYLDVQIQVLQDSNITTNGTVVLLAKENEMDFHWETKKSRPNSDFAAVSFIAYTQMESILDADDLEMENKKYGTEYLQLNSDVLTATITSNNQSLQNVTFSIKNKEVDDVEDYTVCVHLHGTDSKNVWSTSGCSKMSSNRTHTVCNCKHLSSFAVLVALYKVEGPALTTITYIGIIISLACLLIAIITFIMCRAIQSTRTTIHTHLCLCLFVAELLFLIGISATGNRAVCGVIAGILHYLFLACFMWMLLEGVQLYLMVVKVFLTQTLRGKYTYPVAYGIPAIILFMSAAINPKGYGTREHCWLTIKKGFLWSFVGPMCVICLVNFVFLILTIWKLAQKFYSINPDLPNLLKIRMFIITALAQLVLLGCMWIFGVLHFQARTIALAYIFTITNSFQGTFIFILHCLANKQVRDEYRKWIASICIAMKISKYMTFTDSSLPSSSTRAPMQDSHSSL
ncbi:adhesion G protein-coupled receptor E2-like isoform X2 [Heterodontus francisci]|uniref:adhesion G protein-coupled receptor E2-like isoform X2 n=1 Tax=Heterodontus francisci TaxID=7792 RepID=UPI00355BB340